MIRINKGLALAASLTVVVVGLGTGIAFASGPEPSPNDDSISPANHSFTGNNSGNITFKGTINFVNVTVTCTMSTITGTTPSSGLGPVSITPSFSGCTDSLGGTDTITPSAGWTLTFCDQSNDEGLVIPSPAPGTTDEPPGHGSHPGDPHCSTTSTGDALKVTIPQNGATFKSTANNCTITVAPSGSASIIGAYDDVNTLTFSGASLPVAGNTCTASSTAVTGKYVSNITIQDVSS